MPIPGRVQHRRGSASAVDPWGIHLQLNMNPGQMTTCKLTILRINPTPPIQLDDQPPFTSTPSTRLIRRPFPERTQAPREPWYGEGREHAHELRFRSRPRGLDHGREVLATDTVTACIDVLLLQSYVFLRTSSSRSPSSPVNRSLPPAPRTPSGSLAATTGSGRNSFTAILDEVFLPFCRSH